MPGAEQHFNDAIAIEKDIGDKANLASTLDSLADLLLARGDLTGAEQKYREAMSIQEQLGGKGKSATSRAGLAAILLERGQSSQAETAIRQPLAEFRSEKDPENEISARVLLIRALLAQKKLTEAQTEMSVAERLVGNTLERSLRYKIAITAAHMSVALGGRSNQTGAINTLENVATEAKKAGMLALELEARLAIGETEQAQGKVALANAHLNAVRREAVEKGFTLIAKKAAK